MFYSQFILAKKGPLGTIWIAAHLERKLRKNQVADTDIGVSVDSILCPEVPIALRLSSHLLLGVVRIYNRKVNYLFDDCSEALLKVKQAFRSTAVDLPPEESKAPYHSITLPETFDLDDFELPDNDFFQGNCVDHHVGSREQITLQDTMEGVNYSTSKFGLDERFGDGDASGLDLDEELFLDRIDTAGHVDESGDPQASGGSVTPLKQDEHLEDRAGNSETMVDYGNEDMDHMDYAEAPCTPGLMEEPNISNVKAASACDEHLESEYHLEFTIKDNSKDVSDEEKQELNNWCSRDEEIEESGKESSPVLEPVTNFLHQVEPTPTASELADGIDNASDVPCGEYLQNTTIDINNTCFMTVNESHNDQGLNEIGLQEGPESSELVSTFQEVSDGVIAKDPLSLGFEVSSSVENASIQLKSCPNASELDLGNQDGILLENPVTQACQETTDSHGLNLDAHDKEASQRAPFLRPCKSRTELQSVVTTKSGCSMSVDADIQSDIADVSSFGREETAKLVLSADLDSEDNSKENQVQEPVSGEAYHSTSSGQDAHAKTTNSLDNLVENLNDSVAAELPAPEKLLSVPEGQTDLYRDMMVEFSPRDSDKLDEGDAGSKTVAGRKRSFTESTLTEQSLNSVESSKLVRFKKTAESVPDDDDLLSMILAGRRYSVLKVKPTPLSEVTSTKRTRSAPHSSAPKRKVLMDDTMVLHGDAIRQQLTSTEDIRRVRKKAPCTRPEISMIKNQHLEDEIFLEPLFTGISVELASLHNQVYDLSRIKVCATDVTATIEITPDLGLGPQDKGDGNNDPASESVMNNHVIESDTAPPDQTDVTEQSEVEAMKEPLSARDNEIADEACVNPPLSKTRLEEVNGTEVIACQEQIEPTNDAYGGVSQQEPLLDIAEVETGLLNADVVDPTVAEIEPLGSTDQANGDKGDVTADMVQMVVSNETDQSVDASGVLPYQNDSSSANLHFVDFDDGQAIVGDEVREKGDINGEGDRARDDDIFSDMARDCAGDELVPNAKYGELLDYNGVPNEFYNSAHEEQHAQEIMLEGGSMYNNNGNADQAYQPNLAEADFSGFDVQDRNDLHFFDTGNDTEFLNVDDDELNEMADDADDTRITENSGWSSRTRAVSKYLQTAFVNEAERGRRFLSMENLLIGKSREEASRMFFETLVLKTRDYIHVEQAIPFDDIVIKPRTMMMKSDF